MFSQKIKTLMLLVLFSLLAGACGGQDNFNEQVAAAVALTQTALVPQQPPATLALQLASPIATIAPTYTFVPSTPTSTVTPVPIVTGAYQPLSSDECSNLENTLAQNTGLAGVIQNPAPFTNYTNQVTGMGCQVTFSVTGSNNVMDSSIASTLQSLGWTENIAYAAAGPAKALDGYQKVDALCLTDSTSAPVDPNKCPQGPNYFTCMGNLPADQVMHTTIVNCARLVP